MSANTNAVPPYVGANSADLLESLGITQFNGLDSWSQTIGGLVIQGGVVDVPSAANVSVSFPAPLSKQLLGIFLEEADVTSSVHSSVVSSNLTGFTFAHNHTAFKVYWFAIGV
jgi:hypothetical protein